MHLTWSHVCCQPSLKPCVWPISNSLPNYQEPHPLPICIPTPSHHVYHWNWWQYHLWPPSRALPRQIIPPKDIQWPCWFCGCWRLPCRQWKIRDILRHPFYFWCCRSLIIQNLTSLCSSFNILQSPYLFLSHKNDLMDRTHPTKHYIPSIWFYKSHLWGQST